MNAKRSAAPQVRHSAAHPCPVCGGHDGLHRGQGQRCSGFVSGDYVHCSREEHAAAGNSFHDGSKTYAHKLHGECPCGQEHRPAVPDPGAKVKAEIVATYDYRGADGEVLFQSVRMRPKSFRQRRPDPSNRGKNAWAWNLTGVEPVPYRLPELLDADPDAPVFIAEGEKDCDRLASFGLVATTNPMGAGKWRDAYSPHFKGRDVVILPDNDQAGRDHAEQVARSLAGVARSVKVLALPDLPEKGDVSDWLNRGRTMADLKALATSIPDRSRHNHPNHSKIPNVSRSLPKSPDVSEVSRQSTEVSHRSSPPPHSTKKNNRRVGETSGDIGRLRETSGDFGTDTINGTPRDTSGQLGTARDALGHLASTEDVWGQLSDSDAGMLDLSTVTPKTVTWLLKNRIPMGKFTMLAGEGGLGKTFLLLSIAAGISTGREAPGGEGERYPLGDVIILTAEDDPEDTIVPRLMSMDADLKRIVALGTAKLPDGRMEPINLSHIDRLRDVVRRRPQTRMIFVDPMPSFLGRGVDDGKNAELRLILGPLAEFAKEAGIAVIGVTHFNKSASPRAAQRVMGSVAYSNIARATWCLIEDPDNENRRLFLPVKNNLSPERNNGLAFVLEDGVVVWDAEGVRTPINEVLGASSAGVNEAKKEKAAQFLRELLTGKAMRGDDVIAKAKEKGFGKNLVWEAKPLAGVQNRKEGFDSEWLWTIDAPPEPDFGPPPPKALRRAVGNENGFKIADPEDWTKNP